MERLTIHAAEQEQAAAALRESGARLQEELQEADQYMLRTRLLADHSCCLAAAWKKLLSEHGIDVAAVEEPHGEDMADMDAALLQTTLKSQLVGLDKCMLVLQHSRNIHQAMGGEMQQLRERVGALGAAREAAEARECQLQQAAAMLETKLRDLTAASREREEAVRIKAEDGILERKVWFPRYFMSGPFLSGYFAIARRVEPLFPSTPRAPLPPLFSPFPPLSPSDSPPGLLPFGRQGAMLHGTAFNAYPRNHGWQAEDDADRPLAFPAGD